jgi:hypothetical protein
MRSVSPLVSQVAMDAFRDLIAEDFARRTSSDDICEGDLVEFLYAALEYTRSAFPVMKDGSVLDWVEVSRDVANINLFTALLRIESKTPEACIQVVASVLSLQIVPGPCGHELPVPRIYPCSRPDNWPKELGTGIGGRELQAWSDHTFGVVAVPGWIRDRDQRNQAFAAIDPVYSQLSFVEIDREVARRMATFLLAGAGRRSEFRAFERQALALVSLFGPDTRLFSNKSLHEDELQEPFSHGDLVDMSSHGVCAGGSLLALLVTDGHLVVRLEEIWDRWVES